MQYVEEHLRLYRQWGNRLRARSGLPSGLRVAPEPVMEELQLLATGEVDVAGVSLLTWPPAITWVLFALQLPPYPIEG